MPVVSRIKADAKTKGFFEVTIELQDGSEQKLNVHEDVLVREQLHKGLELPEQQWEQLLQETAGIQAYHSGIRFLSYRMRSVYEIKAYLKKKEFTPEQIAYAVQRLKKEKLLDDQAFAASFMRTRIELSNKGPQLIYRELLQAGISPATAAETEQLFPENLQLEHARNYLSKQLTSVKNKKSAAESRKVLGRLLMQRGYPPKISRPLLDEISGFLQENEENALNYQADKALQKFRKLSGTEWKQKTQAFLYRKGFSSDRISIFLEEYGGPNRENQSDIY